MIIVFTDHSFTHPTLTEVTLEWRLLGSPGNLFGFSRTPSWGFHWAKDACSRQLGDVTLANLDTHFDDVKQFIANTYPSREFWVDATFRDGGKSIAICYRVANYTQLRNLKIFYGRKE